MRLRCSIRCGSNLRSPILVRRDFAAARFNVGISRQNIQLIGDKEGWKSAIEELKQEKAVGFDTETRPEFSASFKTKDSKTAPHLIQFSTRKKAFLFSTLNIFEDKKEMTDLLSQVLGNEAIVKVGFDLRNDKEALVKNYKVQMTEMVDLSTELPTRNMICSLVEAVQVYLHEPFKKNKNVTLSNWAQPLSSYSPAMIEYAANDAYLALLVYDAWVKNNKEHLLIPSHEARYAMILQQREARQKALQEEEEERKRIL